MNPTKVSFQILFLDKSPADRTFLGLQCYSSIRVQSLKNIMVTSVRFFVPGDRSYNRIANAVSLESTPITLQ